ncbi:hypothetical protein GKE82_22930 [Conexibacter sp. W3-3-2]|uniref:hypothetical protein n=1 Tax=Conexibacter sp. W3-3-2 TaxID=2675227 RepID=UPI0012B85EB2|nr:hypothetical protein [Conexibacter sp. W3-3-2]MTD47064.1 hypothetical protein [Conexibacter sp. W3-3-2]
MEPAPLPLIDEHVRALPGDAAQAWDAVVAVLGRALDRSLGPLTHVWGFQPPRPGGPRPLQVGSWGPGFTVTAFEPGERLDLSGHHRFARYRLEVLLDPPADGRVVVRVRTLATFRGRRGRVYRALVIGTGAHVVAMGRLLAGFDRARRRAPVAA